MSDSENQASGTSQFDFKEGDTVRVRVRKNGTSGKIVAKFDAEVKRIKDRGPMMGEKVDLDPPWDSLTPVSLKPYDAEFEVIERAE